MSFENYQTVAFS